MRKVQEGRACLAGNGKKHTFVQKHLYFWVLVKVASWFSVLTAFKGPQLVVVFPSKASVNLIGC